mgnify:CR=1 FL=1
MFNRRGFLKSASVAAAGSVGLPHIARPAEVLHAQRGQSPRHIIHLVSDGMSAGTLSCADQFSQISRGRDSTWMTLGRKPTTTHGLMNMRSLNSLVTDSSAAASSWGSGTRIINGKVNRMSDGRPLKTLYELLREAGWRTGLVTTAEITHATPAGFVACVEKRDEATTIARQYLDREVDVLLGGGAKFFDPKYRLDKQDLRAAFAGAGYFVMDNKAQLSTAPGDRRWLGLFARGHVPYTIDHLADPKLQANVPTLAEMTAAALRRLEHSSHFMLQVEGARIDHACHNNDAAATFHDQLAFDEALDVCLEFQQRVPDTLLVISTDHGNANPGLNGTGDSYKDSSARFANLQQVKRSFVAMLPELKRQSAETSEGTETDAAADKAREVAKSKEEKEQERIQKKIRDEDVATPTEIIEIIAEATGYKVPHEKAQALRTHLTGAAKALYDMRKSDVCALGEVMSNFHAVGFTGTAHTSDYVPVMAVGPGAEKFAGFIQNTDVFQRYLEFAKIDFRNPDEPLTARHDAAPGGGENVEEYQLV